MSSGGVCDRQLSQGQADGGPQRAGQTPDGEGAERRAAAHLCQQTGTAAISVVQEGVLVLDERELNDLHHLLMIVTVILVSVNNRSVETKANLRPNCLRLRIQNWI